MSFTLYKRLFQYIRPYLSRLVLAIFFSIIVGAIATSPVPIIQKTFDKVFVEKDAFMLMVIPLALAGLYLVKGVLTYAQNLIIFGISWELVVSVREKLFSHIHSLPFEFFEANQTGHLISRIINDVAVMQSTVTRTLKELMQNVVMALALLIWLFYLKWQWAIIAIIIFPLMVFPISNISRKLKRLSHKGQEILADINAAILESFSGIKIVRSFGLESREKARFNSYSESFIGVMKKNVKYVEIVSPLLEFLGVLSAGVVLWYGGNQVLAENVTQGTFIAFIVAMFMLYGPLRLLFRLYANVQISLAAAERVFSILDLEEEKAGEGTEILENFRDRIEFRQVTFRYPSRDAAVLKGIDVEIKKSDVLAIVGVSGAGKTTLIDLLFRFYNAASGKILIDGKDIREYRLHSLRRNLALVTQETFLFNDSIWNNIFFGKSHASDEEVLRAAKAAHVDHFVKDMDDGYETVIGERGVKLSGGQRQRISIARAILRDAPILVLDEATSALDSESEKLVQDALHNLMENRTTLVISHRLSTIKNADRIIVLDEGEIAETGTHASLFSDGGLYRKYFEMQMFDFEEPIRNTGEIGKDAV